MKTAFSLCLMICSIVVFGCQPNGSASSGTDSAGGHSEDHHEDHASHHPGTFEEAAKQVAAMGEEILSACENGTPDSAHGVLHEIGHVIASLPHLAAKTSLDDEERRTIDDATEKLMSTFGALDDALHGGKGKSTEEIRQEFDASREQLNWALDRIKGADADESNDSDGHENDDSEDPSGS